jgi:hypothetical protein
MYQEQSYHGEELNEDRILKKVEKRKSIFTTATLVINPEKCFKTASKSDCILCGKCTKQFDESCIIYGLCCNSCGRGA